MKYWQEKWYVIVHIPNGIIQISSISLSAKGAWDKFTKTLGESRIKLQHEYNYKCKRIKIIPDFKYRKDRI